MVLPCNHFTSIKCCGLRLPTAGLVVGFPGPAKLVPSHSLLSTFWNVSEQVFSIVPSSSRLITLKIPLKEYFSNISGKIRAKMYVSNLTFSDVFWILSGFFFFKRVKNLKFFCTYCGPDTKWGTSTDSIELKSHNSEVLGDVMKGSERLNN